MLPWLEKARLDWLPRASAPLRIRAWLSAPVAFDPLTSVTLDGALGWVVVERASGVNPLEAFGGGRSTNVDIPIPVDDVDVAGRRVACASIAVFPSCAVETMRWRRKRARYEMLNAPGGASLRINGGPFKSLNTPVATATSPWLDFFVRGDRERIESLLLDVGGLSRDRARGLGTVLGFEVEDDPEDRSLVWRGAPQRPLPLQGVARFGELDPETFSPLDCGFRAPYWRVDNKTLCAMPHVRVGAALEAA